MPEPTSKLTKQFFCFSTWAGRWVRTIKARTGINADEPIKDKSPRGSATKELPTVRGISPIPF